jgi:predicted nucleotidyltransferase
MKVAAIIAEYNPFHNGHAYHIQKTKEILSVDAVVAVMSGNFVQRGDVSICDKFTRAQAAVYGGCDLVIELPVSFCVSSANRFAFGGISLISALNIIDYISFGSECEDIDTLLKLADDMTSKKFSLEIKRQLESGISYALARSLAAKELWGEKASNILSAPNNILAIEYLMWQKKLCPNITAFSLKRYLTGYHDLSYDKAIASASGIRTLLREIDNADISSIVP